MKLLSTDFHFNEGNDFYTVRFGPLEKITNGKPGYAINVYKNDASIYTAFTTKFANKTQAKTIIEKAIAYKKRLIN